MQGNRNRLCVNILHARPFEFLTYGALQSRMVESNPVGQRSQVHVQIPRTKSMYSWLQDGQLLGNGHTSESSIRPYKRLNVRMLKRPSSNARLYHFIMLRSVLGSEWG